MRISGKIIDLSIDEISEQDGVSEPISLLQNRQNSFCNRRCIVGEQSCALPDACKSVIDQMYVVYEIPPEVRYIQITNRFSHSKELIDKMMNSPLVTALCQAHEKEENNE